MSVEYLTHSSRLGMMIYSLKGMTLNTQSKLAETACLILCSSFSQVLSESYFEYTTWLKGFHQEGRKVMSDNVCTKICNCKFPDVKAYSFFVVYLLHSYSGFSTCVAITCLHLYHWSMNFSVYSSLALAISTGCSESSPFRQQHSQFPLLLKAGRCSKVTSLSLTLTTLFKVTALTSSTPSLLCPAQFCFFSILYTYHLLRGYIVFLLIFTVFYLSSPTPAGMGAP